MAATSSLKITLDLTRELEAATKTLLKRDLLVGIPGDSAPRVEADGKEVSNAVLGYVHEMGDDSRNIPPRPFLFPGVEAARAAIVAGMEQAGRSVLDGNAAGMDKGLTAAGLAAQAKVKQTILDGDFAPLSERTLEARARRLAGSGKLSMAETSKAARKELASRRAGELPTADAKPLYDTGSMFNSITFVIRDKREG